MIGDYCYSSLVLSSVVLTESRVPCKLNFPIELPPSPATRSISPGPAGVGGAPLGERLDYLLLGQEEYLEHHSEITHCRFTTSGSVVASSDVDGVLKV